MVRVFEKQVENVEQRLTQHGMARYSTAHNRLCLPVGKLTILEGTGEQLLQHEELFQQIQPMGFCT